jgi:hypothetical protein
MEFHDWWWLIWIAAVFLPYELYAAFSKKKGDTLSENVWAWFAINQPDARYGRLRRLVLIGFWCALGSHFVYGTPVTFVVIFGVGMAASVWFHYRKERKR